MSGKDKLAGRNSCIESQSRDVHVDSDLITEARLYFLEGSGARATNFLAAVNQAATCSVYILPHLRRVQILTWGFVIWARGRFQSDCSMARIPRIKMPADGNPTKCGESKSALMVTLASDLGIHSENHLAFFESNRSSTSIPKALSP
jgi:hypothetical protein